GESCPALSTPVRLPNRPWKNTVARSGPLAPSLCAKKRIHGSTRLIGSAELRAVAPGPSWSELEPEPETSHGSFPATTDVSPVTVEPAVPASKPRFGKAQYASWSPHAVNGWLSAPHDGRSRPDTRPPEATGTTNATAPATAQSTNTSRNPLPPMSHLS